MSGSNRRMIINTAVMYGKMFVFIIISLLIARLVLDVLGVSDFGIYSVVGGFVTMFSFLNASMASATQRYITFELGKTTDSNVQKIFSASMYSHVILAIIILLLGELVGLAFFEKYINVPADRYDAALFVFHFSLFTLVLGLLSSPYKAIINAYEKMKLIAIIDTANLFLKLIILYALINIDGDNLKIYSFLLFLIAFITLVSYFIITKRLFPESRLIRIKDKKLIKEIFSYGGYSLIGSISHIGVNQGFAFLLNIFFGPLLNAAFGVANSVNGQLRNFANNIITAVNPQLIKRYAAGEQKAMMDLTYQSSKFAFFALLLIATPFFFEIDYILNLWLTKVPEHSAEICQLIIVAALIDVCAQPTMTIIQATGNIKKYQIVTGGIALLNVPIAYALLKNDFSFNFIFYVNIFISLIVFYARLLFAKNLVGLKIEDYFKNVLLPLFIVLGTTLALIWILYYFILGNTFIYFSVRTALSLLVMTLIIFQFGLHKDERNYLTSKIEAWVSSKKKKEL